MTNTENIHYHLEKLVLQAPEIATLIARYTDSYKHDNRTITTLLHTIAEHDPFFVGLRPGEFRKTLSTYKMPLIK